VEAVKVRLVPGGPAADPARRVAIRAADGGCISVRSISPLQLLAWRLSALATSRRPRAGDLYFAVRLAERFFLPPAVLEETFRQAQRPPPTGPAAHFVAENWGAGWDKFRKQNPLVEGEASEWLGRLRVALEPTFATSAGVEPPPRPATHDPPWRTPTVVAVAAGIDESRAFGRLPILGDALEDAGCDDADLLAHCRANGPHPRGCQVVEFLLKK
jgi:hypothetical protein